MGTDIMFLLVSFRTRRSLLHSNGRKCDSGRSQGTTLAKVGFSNDRQMKYCDLHSCIVSVLF